MIVKAGQKDQRILRRVLPAPAMPIAAILAALVAALAVALVNTDASAATAKDEPLEITAPVNGDQDTANSPHKTPKKSAAEPLEVTKPMAARAKTGNNPTGSQTSHGPRYQVDRLVIKYVPDGLPGLPSTEQIQQVQSRLFLTDTGFVAPQPDDATHTFTLAQIDQLPSAWFYASAINQICLDIVAHVNRQGLAGIFVGPDPSQIKPKRLPQGGFGFGDDLRPKNDRNLKLIIRIAVVQKIRTIGSGQRVPSDERRIDHPAHGRIRRLSPVAEDEVLNKKKLDDYLFRLKRHPGRRVDAAVSAGPQLADRGHTFLDLLIQEAKPWAAYVQASNTGTEETGDWRERFGYVHNQLTGNDDIFSVEYITDGFDDVHAVIGSYEAPIGSSDWLRWRAFGTWNEYTASDVGLADEQFKGDGWKAGGELIANILQHRDAFVDAVFGARWENVTTDENVQGVGTLVSGDEDFFLPYASLRFEQISDQASTLASLTLEGNVASIADTSASGVNQLGRSNVDDDWIVMQWGLSHSSYLEPLLVPEAWGNPEAPGSKLAHEVALVFKGQSALDSERLIAQFEQVVGGLYTVRGYDESAAVGDTVVIASLEYRYHVPRGLPMEPNPSETPLFGRPFRFSRQTPFGKPEWDLILRAFFDIGQTINSKRLAFEQDETLMGAGLGIEFLFKRNLNLRMDWAAALQEIGDTQTRDLVKEGSNRFHFVLTLLY